MMRLCAGLAEDLGQSAHGTAPRRDQVLQHRAGADARQLVDIAHQQQVRLVRQRVEQPRHERRIHHRDLIHHEEIAVDPFASAAAPGAFALELEQTMR